MSLKVNSLLVKLILSFTALILPLYWLSVTFTTKSSNDMQSEVEKALESKILIQYSFLHTELTQLRKLLSEYSADNDIFSLSTLQSIMTPYQISQSLGVIEQRLRQIQSRSPLIKEVTYYVPAMNKKIGSLNAVSDLKPDEMTELFELRRSFEGPLFGRNDRLFLTNAYPFYLDSSAEPNFVLEIEIDTDMIVNQLRTLNNYEQGASILSIGQGKLLYSSGTIGDPGLLKTADGLVHEDGTLQRSTSEDAYLFQVYDKSFDFRLISYIPKSDLLTPISRYQTWMWELTAVSIVLIFAFSFGIYQLVHAPLQSMLSAFKKVEIGNFSPTLVPRRKDEFHYLYSKFNVMVSKLRELIEENYVYKLRTQEAKLKQLQSQVDPHFLYNSLFTIEQMAEMEDLEGIKQFANHLGEYYRFITHDLNEEIPLSQELAHARYYLDIQGKRFYRKLHLSFEELPSLGEQVKVPRLIVQPLLENAFEHAMKTRSDLELAVRFREEGDLLEIEVADNGRNVTEVLIEELNHRLAQSTSTHFGSESTGVVNIHRRLKLYYGEKAGLTFHMNEWQGLSVTLAIPNYT